MSVSSKPLILRLYGIAAVVHPRDPGWERLSEMFPALAGSRQIFDMTITDVSSSCGSGVPIMTVDASRGDVDLEPFYARMTAAELRDYWERKNSVSIDGYPTGIFAD